MNPNESPWKSRDPQSVSMHIPPWHLKAYAQATGRINRKRQSGAKPFLLGFLVGIILAIIYFLFLLPTV